MSKLTEREIDRARLAFLEYDKDGSGSIDGYELKYMLEKMDIKASEADIFNMISEIDSDQSGEISFSEFLKVIEYQKSLNANNDHADILSAYIACGGNADKSGHVDRRVISDIIRGDFGLEIDIEAMMDAVDLDGSGEMEFDEFEMLLSGKASV
mmetsp:Transcript_46954/g.69501  ORF Transcript_46954/g.69501 Transcript_46954/m.69501 type:complete len:154 (+) Transcript_46954:95-556(+)|eukprot:CAMPEP_0195520946 /NCGR_PEP_ID=MMETSP0794_2-20130614/17672_1 /TAXON_ID=515487 /ORGANISM="Stephanopyxis turris, Strain CCMP 815" /LENGTH=153 /DNA_ID=CAMNT_0040650393 /DNA_START=35 /DNA_END=496 /DNA_ORIENTATION=-